jgi:hypothetical protein
MSNLVFQANSGGSITLTGANTASTATITIPATTGNMVTTGDTGTVTSAMLASGVGMTYPGAGIANSTGSAWGTSYTTSGTGTVVALATGATLSSPVIATIVNSGTLTLPTSTDTLVGRATTDTLTNKTLTNPTVTNYVETLYSVTGTATLALTNGTVQKVTTSGSTTITLPASVSGKSFTVIVYYAAADAITWAGGTTLKWAGGTTPTATSATGKYDIFNFYQDGTNTYGSIFGQNY